MNVAFAQHCAVLSVVAPLILAAFFAAVGKYLPRRALDSLSLILSLAVALIGVFLCHVTRVEPVDIWLGGWKPSQGIALGIQFHVDPMGALLLTLIGVLFFSAFLFSWRYFKEIEGLFHALMLAFLAAMAGFVLTGDLFNLFVWFELMTAAAIALCGYKSEEAGPLQGALHLAVINTIGAFLSLTGIALIYSATGALNMIQIGETLKQPQFASNPLVITAFALIILGFLVKAAIVPFHFWLADAHAVAPTPVCMLFSGVMVELGIYAALRIHWTSFASVLFPWRIKIRALFLAVGIATALVGGIQCLLQRHLKRLLAYSTISHLGLMTCAFALLTEKATVGWLMYVLGHGAVKAALFACAGVLLHHFATLDENELRELNRKRRRRNESYPVVLIATYFVSALGLSGVPPFSLLFGDAWIEGVAKEIGMTHFFLVPIFVGATTSAAALRAGMRGMLGWGDPAKENKNPHTEKKEERESQGPHKIPVVMLLPGVMLLLFGIGMAWFSAVTQGVSAAASHLHSSQTELIPLLSGRNVEWKELGRTFPYEWSTSAWHGVIACAAAVMIAILEIAPVTVVRKAREGFGKLIKPIVLGLRAIHTGLLGDALAWFAFGVALYAGFLSWSGT